MNLMAFGAHPDDIEIQCAGTLCKYKEEGHLIYMACASNGDMGSMETPPAEVARMRKAEMQASANILGADMIWLDIGGPTIHEDEPTRLLFIDAIRQVRPNLVITHHPQDYHDNHRSVHRLVLEAIFQASLPHIKTRHAPITAVPALYYMDNFTGLNFMPTHYVDISRHIERKERMLRAHASQLVWLKQHSGLDIIDHMKTIGKYRGYQTGVAYAEAFCHVPSFPVMKPGTLIPDM